MSDSPNVEVVQLSRQELDDIIEKASQRGAEQAHVEARDTAKAAARDALADVGLENGEAKRDMDDLRTLLQGLRDARSTFVKAIIRFFAMCLIGGLLALFGLKKFGA